MMFGVPPHNIAECLQWAFGKDKLTGFDRIVLVECWNRLHPDLFKIKAKDIFTTPVGHKIGKEFLKAKNK